MTDTPNRRTAVLTATCLRALVCSVTTPRCAMTRGRRS